MTRLMHVATGPYAPPVPRRELTAVSADGTRLYVEEHGPKDAPAVVLAHGWCCSTAFWAPVVRQLAPDHRVVVYDQRGHGRSSAGGYGSYHTATLADDLGAVLDAALAPGEKAVIGGHSMGGMTLMAAAGRPYLRERAAAVLLCSTGSARLVPESRVVPLRARALRSAIQRALLVSRLPMGPVTPLSKKVLGPAILGRGATPAQIEASVRIVFATPRKARGAWGRVLAALDLDAEVARMPVPAAVVHGSADRLTPVRLARRIEELLPERAGFTELAGLGHMTPIEAPYAIAEVLRGLVRDHLAGAPREAQAEGAADATAGTAGGRTPDAASETTPDAATDTTAGTTADPAAAAAVEKEEAGA
ncbi:alpha/beta fold hydrolase [Streptomyces sp. B8F3]|uniref:alpha/beta fold hydrolase n=1 Tax=Streptomyces sp. B8F3 TaxID=3153573 RepID=UPI00325EA20D